MAFIFYYGPIWKNVYFTSDADELEYYIDDAYEGKTIFKGRAYKFPNDTELRICINKICQYYLKSDIDELLFDNAPVFEEVEEALPIEGLQPTLNIGGNTAIDINRPIRYERVKVDNPDATKEFIIKDKDGNTLSSYTFYMDWSYKENTGFNPDEDNYLSHPINGHYAIGMKTLDTVWSGSTYKISTSILSTKYKTLACGNYAVYYLNANGGWDSFLIEGNVKRSDKLTHHNFEQTPQRTITDWGNTRYSTDIVPEYELVTGWLNDEQSENLASNLLSSTRVYLHNLKSDDVIPVVITDTVAQHKTYATNGKKLSNYTIKVNESQTHYRR